MILTIKSNYLICVLDLWKPVARILPGKLSKEGESVVFTCHYEGYPAIACKWMKDGINITNNCLNLKIHNLSRTDSGHYRCEVENIYGVNKSDDVFLDIYCESNISKHLFLLH